MVHNMGLTIAWSGLYNVSLVLAIFKFSKIASLAHTIIGYVILFLTYLSVLWLLIPFGYNLTV
jgi:hypothetical protein